MTRHEHPLVLGSSTISTVLFKRYYYPFKMSEVVAAQTAHLASSAKGVSYGRVNVTTNKMRTLFIYMLKFQIFDL